MKKFLLAAVVFITSTSAQASKVKLFDCTNKKGDVKIKVQQELWDRDIVVSTDNERYESLYHGWVPYNDKVIIKNTADLFHVEKTKKILPEKKRWQRIKIDRTNGTGIFRYYHKWRISTFKWGKIDRTIELANCIANQDGLTAIKANIKRNLRYYTKNKNQPSDVFTSLLLNDNKTFKKLLAKGVNPNFKAEFSGDFRGWTPLIYTSFYSETELGLLLLSRPEIDVNAKGDSGKAAVHFAVQFGNETLLKKMVENNVNLEARDNRGSTPAHEAAGMGNGHMLTILKGLGTDLDLFADYTGMGRSEDEFWTRFQATPLMIAIDKIHVDAVNALVSIGADVNATNTDGDSVLHIASRAGFEKPLLSVLEAGAKVNVRNNKGESPLDLARFEKTKEILKKFGAN